MASEYENYIGVKFKTRFIARDVDAEGKLIEDIIEQCKRLTPYGLTRNNAGNVSVRADKGMLITGSGAILGRLRKEDFVQVISYDEKENLIIAKGQIEPSSEAIMHFLVYKNFPTIKTIVHVHDACVLDDLQLAKKLKLRFTKKTYPYGTPELAREAVNAVKFGNYVILSNHGSLLSGKKLKDLIDLAIDTHKKFVHPMDTLKGL